MRKLLLLLSTVLFLNACSTHEKILKSDDVNYKLTKGNEYYDEGKWVRAKDVYERLLPVFRGTPNYEELYYRYAYTLFNMEDYLMASYQFRSFIEFFPRSTRKDECEFMYAKSLYLDSPRASLDQTSTIKSIEALQNYINNNPNSKRITEANNYMDIARSKILEKDTKASELYYNMGKYKSAAVAFKTLTFDYPESDQIDYYYLMVIKSYSNYARLSNTERQEERYAEVISTFNELKEYYPHSNHLKEAERYMASAQNIINKLRNEHK